MDQTAPYELGFKAVVEVADDGTLVIEGIAADTLDDRQEEAFEAGALELGMNRWMEAGGLVGYLHDPTKALGRATKAWVDGKSIKVRAEIPQPTEQEEAWKHTAYNGIKNGIIRGFSIGGKFKRHLTPSGPRIYDIDWQELTVAPIPINPRTLFALAGKAFGEDPAIAEAEALVTRLETVVSELEKLAR